MKLTKKYKIVYSDDKSMLMSISESALYDEIHVGEGMNSFETDNLEEAEKFVRDNGLKDRHE